MADEDQFEAAPPDPDERPDEPAGASEAQPAEPPDGAEDASRAADEAMAGAEQALSGLEAEGENGPEPAAQGGAESAALAAAMEAIRMVQHGGEQEGDPAAASDPTGGPDPSPGGDAGNQEAAGASQLNLPDLDLTSTATDPQKLELLADVNVTVKIELGRTRMLVEDVLKLGDGAVVELEKLAGDPVDIFVNERPVARGEVLVLNDNFCVRVNEILDRSSEEKD